MLCVLDSETVSDSNETIDHENDAPLTSIRVEREFAAQPRAVFDAWVVSETASRWLFSTETSVMTCVMDPRPGGAYRIERTEVDESYVAVGEYREVNPPHRLVFTFGMPQFAPGFATVTVEVEPAGAGTRMRLTQDSVPPEHKDAIREGWSAMFDLLERALAE